MSTGMRQILIEARCPHCGDVVPLDAERAFDSEDEQIADCVKRIDAHIAVCTVSTKLGEQVRALAAKLAGEAPQ